jgi:hypothetical protein
VATNLKWIGEKARKEPEWNTLQRWWVDGFSATVLYLDRIYMIIRIFLV